MLKHCSRSKRESKRKRITIRPSLNISAKKTRLSMRSNKRPKGWEKKKKERSSVCENCKKRLLTDKLKSTPWEQREPLRRVRDRPEKEKSLNRPRGKESKPILKKQDKNNSKKKPLPWPSKLASREKTTCTRSKNKNRSSCKKGKSKKIENKRSLNILTRSEVRLLITKISRSRIDWTTWRKAEKWERKSTWRETRSRTSRRPKYRNCRTSA